MVSEKVKSNVLIFLSVACLSGGLGCVGAKTNVLQSVKLTCFLPIYFMLYRHSKFLIIYNSLSLINCFNRFESVIGPGKKSDSAYPPE